MLLLLINTWFIPSAIIPIGIIEIASLILVVVGIAAGFRILLSLIVCWKLLWTTCSRRIQLLEKWITISLLHSLSRSLCLQRGYTQSFQNISGVVSSCRK
jgi:hypothetical protein